MNTMTCQEIEQQGLVEGYVGRTLTVDEAEAFERHLVACERCQQDLELALTVRSALRRAPAQPAPKWAPVRRRQPVALRRAAVLGTLAAAAVLVLVLVPRLIGPDARVAALGEVRVPPIYLGLPVRDAEGRADTLFERAMDAYVASRYGAARRGLEAALAAGADPAATQFFLGASLLMLGRPRDAAEAFGRVLAAGRSPYVQEAHLYRAKALLRLGEAEAAMAELRAAAGPNAVGGVAESLAVRVEELVRR